MIAALFPATVSADSTDSITVDGVTLDAGAPYLANGASTACADRPDSGGYAFYDAATGTLTLHNAVISGAASDTHNYGIYSESDITVHWRAAAALRRVMLPQALSNGGATARAFF